MPYVQHRTELCVEKECLLWGTQVVIPKVLQAKILQLLHDNHPGITHMKSLGTQLHLVDRFRQGKESLGELCGSCQTIKTNPAAAPLPP